MQTTPPTQRILTGDTPSGRLHIGHWVGSLENRVRLQSEYDCYFLIANLHAFTTRATEPEEIAKDTIHILKDWLAAGIDPERATIVVQSEVPAIVELTWHLSMLLTFNRVVRNPTLKGGARDEIARRQVQLRVPALRGRTMRRHSDLSSRARARGGRPARAHRSKPPRRATRRSSFSST